MTPALLVQDLTVSLHGRHLVNGLNFELAPGENVALLGASGSGKSLTAAAVLGALPASMTIGGRLQVNGTTVPLTGRRPAPTRPAPSSPGSGNTGSTDHGSGRLAAIHQDPITALNPLVALGKQLTIPLRRAGFSASEARCQAAALLAAVGINDTARTLSSYSGELSGGELQRICIALALACRPSVLVADEPTTALDVVSQAKVLDVLAGPTASAQAILFITHDLAAAQVLCSRALVMFDGRIVEEGTMDTLLSRPQHHYTARLVEAACQGFPAPGTELSA
ncbi:ATP-binding cassette domain-containing protein [Arthrobacter sp. ISL-72]|uniref:ATP-binding cassette domain-containing protein n=1 Tax=Arthrobacter sp. ISL-72 TaxID=2819114 RepID=UPI001BEB88D2|nr:ATP-binding cassette domain-containing protein [Arthrobacter sp. ISL-72]MBT2596300.1 ABC transporter ATP-binding protein [Arthrobacter sp. ISL-72]